MNTKQLSRIFARAMYCMVIVVMVFSATGSVYAQEPALTVGLVLNANATQDNDFNWMAQQGLLQAETELGISSSEYQPSDQGGYDEALQQCADENDLCIAVGFDFVVSLANVARDNPDTNWAAVDLSYPDCWEGAEEGVDCGSFDELDNVRGLRFNEKQAGYLAGVLAGGMTTSNVVGVVGGMEIPPVVAFVEGYRNGADCTNPAVNVLTAYTGTFVDPELGATTAQDMIEQGADIIFGAAGLTGNGAIQHSAEYGQWVIGVDTDQYFTVFGNGTVTGFDKILSSAMKRVDSAVYQTIADFVNGEFTSGTVVYDLATDGVGLAPFHETDGSIPQDVKDNLEEVRQGIVNGTINTDYSCAPPRVYANLPEDGIRFEYSAPGASVSFSIYDSPDGNLLWEDSRTADDSGFVYLSIWDHRVDLKPGIYIVASDGRFTNQLLIEPVSLDVFDPEENILQGTALPERSVWVVANNENVFCGANVDSDSDGNWTVDFGDYLCEVTDDMWAYAQVMDAESDTSEAVLDFIEGYHDYDAGDVPSWACNVGGWAVDTDDRERNLTIRILADGNEVASTVTGNPREDLLGACGADGSCGYEVNLWGSITHYEEHLITAQAYDDETGQWLDLYNSPKELICRTYDIYAYDPLTGETRQISNIRDADEYDPSWSPDGKKIAHDVVIGDTHGIYVTNVQTGVSMPLKGAQNGGNDAAWSPNGSQIVFDRRWFDDPSLYRVPSVGGIPKLVRHDAVNAAWSPNGKFLVFHQPSDGSIRTVFFAAPRGSARFIGYGEEPAWSPDGKWIAYTSDGHIWKVSVDLLGAALGGPILVTSGPFGDGGPTWSRDSTTIIYNTGISRDYDLWSVPAAGGTPTWLTGVPEFGEYGPAQAKNSSNIAYASFSPNGQAPRTWVSAFTYDAGTWDEGSHTYQFWIEGTPAGEERSLNVSIDNPLYPGLVLIRPGTIRAETPDGCANIEVIHPDQHTRFHVGWTFDGIYADAVAYYENLNAQIRWDSWEPVDMLMHEIFPFTGQVDWFSYTCTFTTP